MPEHSEPKPGPEDTDSPLPWNRPFVKADVGKFDGRHELHSPASNPDLIARDPHNPHEAWTYRKLTEALFHLDEKYGIHFAGIGSKIPKSPQPGIAHQEVFTTTERVTGLNMYHEMDKVPQEVILQTLDTMLRYLEDMLGDTSARLYLSDLSLRQCVYGHSPGDTEKKIYFVDMEPYMSDRRAQTFMLGGLKNDLDKVIDLYGRENIGSLYARYWKIWDALGGGVI